MVGVPVAVWGLLDGTKILAWILARDFSEIFSAYLPPPEHRRGPVVNLLSDGDLVGVYGSLRAAQAGAELEIGL